MKRICVADEDDFVCKREEKSRMEKLIKKITGKTIPFHPYEEILDYKQYKQLKQQSKEEVLLNASNVCIVYSSKDNPKLEMLSKFAKENNIKLIVVNKKKR